MSPLHILTIVSSVSLSALSQILLKRGMISDGVRAAIDAGKPSSILVAVATSPSIWLGFVSFGVSVAIWLLVLARTPLSTAYPFVSLGIGVTVIAGLTLFGEPVSITGAVGVGFIVLGILFVASQG